KITDINKNIEKISGYKRDELIGESPTIFNSSKSSSLAKEVISSKVDSGEVWQGEMNYQRKDGTLYWVYETIALVVGAEGEPDQFISIQYDITEAKKIKRDLVREVIEAQEQERERFAMEIHDGLGQVLLAAKMNLNALADASDGLENESKEILNTSIELLNNAVQEARGISHGLMSRVLNRFGLAHAIDEIVGNIGRSSGLDFNFKHNIVKERFSDEIEMGLYRTLQELIQNVLKHSKATKADLIILKEGNDLLIKISDNGIGIAKTTILNPESGGIGLRNMRSRIEYLGGEFKIANQVKKGTLITIQITL
ncbi:MAG: PAS domain-containing sensor histidine kinase, partial [Vicingaceae bacterium]